VIEIIPLTEETMDPEIDLCLKFHPSGYIVPKDDAIQGRIAKRKFLKKVFKKVRPAGFIAIEHDKPLALLELMPREIAARNGYITGSNDNKEDILTIVCLEVTSDQNRKQVMELMVTHLVNNLELFKPFKTIEVGAFPQNVDFHPAWVYEDNGFIIVEDRSIAKVLSVSIPDSRV
jgi:hypothetical protein